MEQNVRELLWSQFARPKPLSMLAQVLGKVNAVGGTFEVQHRPFHLFNIGSLPSIRSTQTEPRR